jgi:hypothetical protein
MHRSKLLDRRAIPPTTGGIPVRTDVFLHGLEPYTLEILRQCVEQGLTPTDVDFTGDDGAIAVIRFTRTRAGEARSV